MRSTEEKFGCAGCREMPKKDVHPKLEAVRILYDSSHEDYSLFKCPSCGQMFLYQAIEIISWGDGNDDTWLNYMPVTPEESAFLLRFPEGKRSAEELSLLRELIHLRPRLTRHPDRYYYRGGAYCAADIVGPG